MEKRAVERNGLPFPAVSRKFFFGEEGGEELAWLLEQMELSGYTLEQIMLETGRTFEDLQSDDQSAGGILFSEKLSEIEKDSLRALVVFLGHLADVAPFFVVRPKLDPSVYQYVLGAIEDPGGEISALLTKAVQRVFLRMFDPKEGPVERSSGSHH